MMIRAILPLTGSDGVDGPATCTEYKGKTHWRWLGMKFKGKWSIIKSHNILDSVILPWVRKKIEEYLGENEETLCEFIMSKLTAECSPNELLGELEAVLDSDAEKFVIKIHRYRQKGKISRLEYKPICKRAGFEMQY